ncbi:Enoyl-CoA hydratase 1 [Carabus blaptoides fortunei]
MYSTLVKQVTRSILNNSRNHFAESISVAAMSSSPKSYETLAVTVPKSFVYHVELNRPKNLNALNKKMWMEVGQCFDDLAVDENCRSVVLTGSGKLFTAGIDLKDMMSLSSELADAEDIARKAKIMHILIGKYQASLTAIEKCNKPVIVGVHGPCVGAGVDIITATDIRYCTSDAWFQVKEVDIGMAADVGTLQRLPRIIGSDSLVRELCYTGRKMEAAEALSCGLVSKVFDNKESMVNGAVELAALIASKSPVAVQGTKASLVYSRDHPVQDGLDHIANHNKSMLQSEDFVNAVMGQISKDPNIQFSKL